MLEFGDYRWFWDPSTEVCRAPKAGPEEELGLRPTVEEGSNRNMPREQRFWCWLRVVDYFQTRHGLEYPAELLVGVG